MKRTFLLLLGSITLAALGASAQQIGVIGFTNDSTSLVINGLTGLPVVSTNPVIKVSLHIGPDGVTDDSQLVVVTNNVSVGLVGPGRYNGNTRSAAPYTVSNYITVQVRAYESAYGNSYEAAFSAPQQNGRRALVGKSSLGRLFLTTSSFGPTTPKVGSFVGPITVLPADGPPLLTANDTAVSEGSNGTAMATFTVRLLGASADTITVDYATADGTALAGSDYVATSGTLTFAPGETVKSVAVTLTPDADAESEETFSLVLSNPVNAILLRSTIICTVVEVRVTALSIDTSVTFNTLSGRRYLVERSTDGAIWTPVSGATNILATGTTYTVIDRGSGCSSLTLYRAGLIPQ